MRVLISSTYYWPELAGNAPYVAGLAEHWAAAGHSVEVLAGVPHYPVWQATDVPAMSEHERVRVRRYSHYVPRRPNVVSRARYEASLMARGMWALRSVSKPDVVVGICPSLASLRLGLAGARRFDAPFVAVFQDVLSSSAAQSGMGAWGILPRLLGALEGQPARSATVVAVVAEGFKRALGGLGVDPLRLIRVRNWSTLDLNGVVDDRAAYRRSKGWSEQDIVCVYAGAMGTKQGLEVLIDAAVLAKGTNVRFVLAGEGAARAPLSVRASRVSPLNLELWSSLAGPDYAALLSVADVLLLTQRPSVVDMSLPSKLATYLMAGRPIVAAVAAESEAAVELAASGGGVVTPPGDAASLLAAVHSMTEHSANGRSFGDRAKRWATTELARERVLAEYDGILELAAHH